MKWIYKHTLYGARPLRQMHRLVVAWGSKNRREKKKRRGLDGGEKFRARSECIAEGSSALLAAISPIHFITPTNLASRAHPVTS